MKRAIKVGLDGCPFSAIVEDDALPSLKVGELFVFTADFAIDPYGVISKGCKCWVSYTDEVSGRIELTAEAGEPALYWWNDRIQLMPYDTDDVLSSLRWQSARALQSQALTEAAYPDVAPTRICH